MEDLRELSEYLDEMREDFEDLGDAWIAQTRAENIARADNERRAKEEREVGHSCIKGVFLDELDPNAGRMEKEIMPVCGFDCLGILEGEE